MKAKIFVGRSTSVKSIVARMIAEHVGKEKTVWIDGAGLGKRFGKKNFCFSEVHEKTKLIVFDNCPDDFDYEFLIYCSVFSKDYDHLGFQLRVDKMHEDVKDILIPQIILISGKLHTIFKEPFFLRRAEVIKFPIKQPINQ
jgi:hypothetical protein